MNAYDAHPNEHAHELYPVIDVFLASNSKFLGGEPRRGDLFIETKCQQMSLFFSARRCAPPYYQDAARRALKTN
jgi:hypothetical protein